MVSAAVVLISGIVIAIDDHELAVKPPGVTGTVLLQSARNADPRAKQFLDDVQRGEYTWLTMPGTFVEATIQWHLPRRLPSSCSVEVHVLPEAGGRLGATSTSGNVGMGDDSRLKAAFDEPGPPDSLSGVSYGVGPTSTDGTITFVVAYPDQDKVAFDPADAQAAAVVECTNHEALFNRSRDLTGPVTAFPVTTQ